MFNHVHDNIAALYKEVNALEKKLNLLRPIEIVIATKYASLEETIAVLEAGITHIGENKIQDLVSKQQNITAFSPIIHMLGHLQSNKINKCLQSVDFLDSVDSLALLEKLSKAYGAQNKQLKCLIQVNVGDDENKFGFSEKEIRDHHANIFSFQNVQILGIMIVTPQASAEETRFYFKKSKALFDFLSTIYPHLHTLSMGMSNDYKMAIEEGATQIRVGRRIFKKENEQ